MSKNILMLILIVLPFIPKAQKISFFREELDFKLTENTFEVDGLYFFRNPAGDTIHQALYYPFPDSEKYGEILNINVTKSGDTLPIAVRQSRNGAIFTITVPANGEAVYRIRYQQKTVGDEAKYIITTTQNWSKPFEAAAYTLTFPGNIRIDNISILPDSIGRSNEETVYFWRRKNFMPVTDFIFKFHHTEK